jgi:uncharacterized protein (TIGR03083 family)
MDEATSQSAGNSFAAPPRDKAELRDRIGRSRAALEGTIDSLSEAQLAAPGPGGGWSAKDHLAHLAAWERKALAELEGRPPHEVFGVDAASYEASDVDRLNEVVYRRNKERPAWEVLADFRESHRRLLATLERAADADLFAASRPGGSGANPLLESVIGNTYEHYPEHLATIRALSED